MIPNAVIPILWGYTSSLTRTSRNQKGFILNFRGILSKSKGTVSRIDGLDANKLCSDWPAPTLPSNLKRIPFVLIIQEITG